MLHETEIAERGRDLWVFGLVDRLEDRQHALDQLLGARQPRPRLLVLPDPDQHTSNVCSAAGVSSA